MRLSLSINGELRTTASIPTAGHLGAHLNISDRQKERARSSTVRVSGFDTSNETETVYYSWPEITLNVNDRVEVVLLDEGSGDEPSSIRRSSERPDNLFSDVELAWKVLEAVRIFEDELGEVYSRSEELQSAEEHKKFQRSLGEVIHEIGESLLFPIYRRHPELVPEVFKGERL